LVEEASIGQRLLTCVLQAAAGPPRHQEPSPSNRGVADLHGGCVNGIPTSRGVAAGPNHSQHYQ
jgi:hypothetical protein